MKPTRFTYRDQILDDVHVGQRVDLHDRAIAVHLAQARQSVGAVDVHGARPANAWARWLGDR